MTNDNDDTDDTDIDGASIEEYDGQKTVSHHDGRRGIAKCRDCGDGELTVEVDPMDECLWVVCQQCGDDIIFGIMDEARINIGYTFKSLENIDPRVRKMIGEQKLREMVEEFPEGFPDDDE